MAEIKPNPTVAMGRARRFKYVLRGVDRHSGSMPINAMGYAIAAMIMCSMWTDVSGASSSLSIWHPASQGNIAKSIKRIAYAAKTTTKNHFDLLCGMCTASVAINRSNQSSAGMNTA